MKELIFFKTKNKGSPIEEFLDSLNGKQAKKVVWVMQLVEELERVPKQYFKKLVNTSEIWEIRIHTETIRILGFFINNKQLILTNAFIKKSKKTPKQEIALAESRKILFLNRRGK